MNLDKTNLYEYDFIRLVAKRANFTIADTKFIWDVMVEVMKDSVLHEIPLVLYGFGKLYVRTVSKRIGHNPQTMEYEEMQPSKRVVFSISPNFRNIHRKKKRIKRVGKTNNNQ